jgi:hypothetical protein
MANNYTLFSIEIVTNKKEADWFKEALQKPDDAEFDKWPEHKQQAWMKQRGVENFNDDNYPDFGYELLQDEKGRTTSIVFFSEENGNLDQVIGLLQDFLKKFHLDKSIRFEWAFTCSRPRPGEFGGGAAFITSKSIKYMNTGDWLLKTRGQWERRNGRK